MSDPKQESSPQAKAAAAGQQRISARVTAAQAGAVIVTSRNLVRMMQGKVIAGV